MRLASTLLTLLLSFPSLASPTEWLASAGPIPLSHTRASELFRQCSREAPSAQGSIWIPTRIQIQELEHALRQHLEGEQRKGALALPPGTRYRGQYAGFTRNGVRFIYGSFSAEGVLRDQKLNGEPVVWCDGGSQFWGIVYNTSTKAFTELQINGPT